MCIDCQCIAFSDESNIRSFCSGGWRCTASEEQKQHCLENVLKVEDGCCRCEYFETIIDYEDDDFQ